MRSNLQQDAGSLLVVGIGGSLASNSASLAALDATLDIVRLAGEEIARFAVVNLDLPMYGPDVEPTPDALRLAEAVARADAVIWSSPLYHGAISGAFKNAIDWLQLLADHDPPYLTDKPVGLIATAGGSHALQAINCMEFMVRALRGWAVPFVVPIVGAHRDDSRGITISPSIEHQLGTLGLEVLRAARRLGAKEETAQTCGAR